MKASGATYLLLGPEEGEKQRHIDAVLEQIAGEQGGEIDVQRYYPYDTNLVELMAALSTGSLFSPHQVAILGNAEEIKGAKDVGIVAAYCANPASHTTLILTSATVADIAKGLEKAVPNARRKVFWELFPNQKTGWVVQFFRRHNRRVSAEAAELILELVENNTRDLEQQCAALAAFAPGDEVTVDEVERFIFHSKEENVFTLFDRMAQRQLLPAIETLGKILQSRQSEPVQLVMALTAQFRKLGELKSLLAHRSQREEAFRKVYITSKKAQRSYGAALEEYQDAEVWAIITLLVAFDHRLRMVNHDQQVILLQLVLYYAIVRGGRGAWRLFPQ